MFEDVWVNTVWWWLKITTMVSRTQPSMNQFVSQSQATVALARNDLSVILANVFWMFTPNLCFFQTGGSSTN